MNNTISQSHFIKKFNEEHREQFNEDLFYRNTDDIIDELQNSIISCQRNALFIIKVESFTVIEDYATILKMMEDYDQRVNGNNKKKKINPYEFINLKDSDVKLLIVRYYIQVKDVFEYVDVYILVPRIVDKYYFRISGNIYYAMFQIVDGSTYNNSTSKSTKQNITFKVQFMSVKLYRNVFPMITAYNEEVQAVNYTSKVFSKFFYAFKYILARYGFYGTLEFMKLSSSIWIAETKPEKNDNVYIFENRGIYVVVPRVLFDNDYVVQALVHTITTSIMPSTKLEDMLDVEYWLCVLGGEFNNYTRTKGEAVLNSLEGIYDISTRESLRLPEEDKKDIYGILKWMIKEFPKLKAKNNLDVSTKRIRYAEYLASLYAMQLCASIYKLSDLNNKVSIESVRKAIIKRPTLLLESIVSCRTVNYRGLVNDLDSMVALKYTYKGVSGIGESSKKIVPQIYKSVHLSNLGRIDVDSSPKSDPGMSGIICPLVELDRGSFSNFQEPNNWEEEFSELMNNYKSLVSLKEVLVFKEQVLGQDTTEGQIALDESINMTKNVMQGVKKVEDTTEYWLPDILLEEGGNIYLERE